MDKLNRNRLWAIKRIIARDLFGECVGEQMLYSSPEDAQETADLFSYPHEVVEVAIVEVNNGQG